MADSSKPSSEKSKALNLEELRGLEFTPQWSTSVSQSVSKTNEPKDRNGRPRSSGGQPRDRRPAHRTEGGNRKERSARRPNLRPEPFEPVVQFSIYPEDEPFDLLTQSIRSSLKVYELFEISRLILDKADRMVVVVTPLSDDAPPLYECLPDRQIFREEAAALTHAANLILPTIFEESEEEVEAPKGNFSSVLRCSITGKLLPPRSYHRFGPMLQEHHRLNCSNTPLERVEKGLRAENDPERVQEWLQSMSRRVVFRLRKPAIDSENQSPQVDSSSLLEENKTGSSEGFDPSEGKGSEPPNSSTEAEASETEEKPVAQDQPQTGDPVREEVTHDVDEQTVFDSRESAIAFIVRTKRQDLARETRQARIPGRSLSEAADSEIRKSFLEYVERQKRFPLDTANNVRMKLRKAKFFIFKKGKKGISYVAPVRRKSRPRDAVFADSVNEIISVLEKSPGILLKDLPEKLKEKRGAEGENAENQWKIDLKWLKTEGYVYEYGGGSLDIHSIEDGPSSASQHKSPVENAGEEPETTPLETHPDPSTGESKNAG